MRKRGRDAGDGGSFAVAACDVRRAAERLAGRVRRTRTVSQPELDRRAGARVFVKIEAEQETGAFKLRGALNWFLATGGAEDVAAFSAGNHAGALAVAAGAFGRRAHILMPGQAPRVKVERAQAAGARIVFYDRERDDREALLADHARRTGAAVVHAFEDPYVIAGGGTAGLELMEDAGELDALLVPCGGGGLLAGCGLVARERSPAMRLVAVEPEGHDDMGRSLRAGRRLPSPALGASLSDALLTPAPGERTFAIHRALGTEGATVSGAETREAVRFAHRELGVTLEPGGAAGLAAALSGRFGGKGLRLGVIATGGNVDPAVLAAVLASPEPSAC